MQEDRCYIISFQTVGEQPLLIDAIKKYGAWARITTNTWAIVTTHTAKDIRDNLSKLIGVDGRIFVIKSGVEAAWRHVICSNEWLKKNI